MRSHDLDVRTLTKFLFFELRRPSKSCSMKRARSEEESILTAAELVEGMSAGRWVGYAIFSLFDRSHRAMATKS